MKILLIMRHAKSDYPTGIASDFERPLNKRGLKDVPRMAHLVRAFGPVPDVVLSSPAVRAKQTAAAMAADLGPAVEVRFDESLYLGPGSGQCAGYRPQSGHGRVDCGRSWTRPMALCCGTSCPSC